MMKTLASTAPTPESIADPIGAQARAAAHAARKAPSRDDALPSCAPRSARALIALLRRLRHGSLSLTLPGGQTLEFGSGTPRARLRLANWSVFEACARNGDIGFAESFIAGDWECDALIDVLELAVLNRRELDAAVYGHWWGTLLYRLRHRFNRNSRAGSRRNIHAHYDLGNPFYRLWLDPSMTYSSALYAGDESRPLHDAQRAKYRRILDELALGPGASVLEIGCGWGGFAEMAARDGLQVKGLTLSTEQLEYARRRLDGAGLAAQARFELQDYRDEGGRYDGIASIEMFEAVGERYWPDYFARIRRSLAPGGRAVIQTIVIADALFERYRSGTDFIQQYVFPGGMLPSAAAFEAQVRRAGLRVCERFAFGPDYATTLRHWRESFLSRLDDVRALGFDTRFVRTWEFYLAYCEAAFTHGNTDVVQFTLEHA